MGKQILGRVGLLTNLGHIMANKRVSSNAQEVPVDIVGSSTFGRYSKISAAKTYNMFVSENFLVPYAGYQKILDLHTLPGRGMFHSIRGNFLLVVVGDSLISINSNFVPIMVGTLTSSLGEVSMDENLAGQILIVDGHSAWVYNYKSAIPTFTPQTLSANLTPNYVSYHNTYFLIGNAANAITAAEWYVYQPSPIDPTLIVLVTSFPLQTKPDSAIAVHRIPGQGNQVLVFGTSVCEIWTQVAGIQIYQRNSTFNIDYGCVSTETIAASDKYIAWLAVNESNSPVIMIFSGQGATPISTDGIDYLMGGIVNPAKSTAYFWRQDGHLFYVLTFYDPADNLTLFYDIDTQKFYNASDEHLDYHPAVDIVFFNGSDYFLSLNDGGIYNISSDITNLNYNVKANPVQDPNLVANQQRIRITSNIRLEDASRFRINSFTMMLEQGIDTAYSELDIQAAYADLIVTEDGQYIVTETGQYIAANQPVTNYSAPPTLVPPPGFNQLIYRPRIDLSISKTGGLTWGNTVSRTLNTYGHIQNMLHWEGMGLANDLVLKVRFWMDSRIVVGSAVLEIF